MPSSSPAVVHDLPCPETSFLLVVESGGSGSMGWGLINTKKNKRQNKVIDFILILLLCHQGDIEDNRIETSYCLKVQVKWVTT